MQIENLKRDLSEIFTYSSQMNLCQEWLKMDSKALHLIQNLWRASSRLQHLLSFQDNLTRSPTLLKARLSEKLKWIETLMWHPGNMNNKVVMLAYKDCLALLPCCPIAFLQRTSVIVRKELKLFSLLISRDVFVFWGFLPRFKYKQHTCPCFKAEDR